MCAKLRAQAGRPHSVLTPLHSILGLRKKSSKNKMGKLVSAHNNLHTALRAMSDRAKTLDVTPRLQLHGATGVRR